MGRVFRSFLKPSLFLGLMLTGLLLATPRPAFAQLAVDDVGPFEEDIDFTINAIQASIDTLAPDIAIAIQAAVVKVQGDFADNGELAQPGTLIQIDNDLQAIAATITNNSTTQASINAKGVDAANTNTYTTTQQKAQADAQIESGAGSMAYQNQNMCQQVTLQSGASSMQNARLVELAFYNPYAWGSTTPLANSTGSIYQGATQPCSTCDVPGNLAAENSNVSLSQHIHNIMAAAKTTYSGSVEGGTDSATTYLDVDAHLPDVVPVFSAAQKAAYEQQMYYLAGMPPPPLPSATSYKNNTAVYDSALLARKEKLANYNLAAKTMQNVLFEHDQVTSPTVAASIASIYTAANLQDPRQNGAISKAALDQALYQEPADDPKMSANLGSMGSPTKVLQFIADEMMLLNSMEFRRYKQEQDMALIESQILNLENRKADYGQEP